MLVDMEHPIRLGQLLLVVVKAVLITAAILYLGTYFGVRVREAGGAVPRPLTASLAGGAV